MTEDSSIKCLKSELKCEGTFVRLLFHRYGSDSQIPKEEENRSITNPILARTDHTPDTIEKSYQPLSSGIGDCKSRKAHDQCVFSNIHGATRANLDNFRFEESFAEPELIIRDEQSFIRICPGVGKLSFAQMLKILNRLLQDYADACVKVSFPNSDTEICVSSEYEMEYPCVRENPQVKEQLASDKCTVREFRNEKKIETEAPKSTQDSKSSKNNAKDVHVNVSDNQSAIKRTQPTDFKNLVNMHSETLQMKTPEKNRKTTEKNIPSDSERNMVPHCMPANDTNSPTPKENPPIQQSNKTTNMENTTATDKPATKKIIQSTQSGPTESTRNMKSANSDLNSSYNKQTASTESNPNARKGTLVDKVTKVNNVNVNKVDNNASQTKGLKNSKQCNKGTPRMFCEEGAGKLKMSRVLNEREKKADGQAPDASSTPLTPKKENRSNKCENKTPNTPPYNPPAASSTPLTPKKENRSDKCENKTPNTPPYNPPAASSTPLTPKKENRSDKCENKTPNTPPYIPPDASSTPLTPKKENRSDKCENKTPNTPPYNPPSSVKLQLLQKKISELERAEEREKQLQHVEKLRNESMAAIHAQRKRTTEINTVTSKQKSPNKTAHQFDSDSSEDEDSCLNANRCDAQERVRKNGEFISNSSDDSDTEVECNFKGKAKSPARELSVLPDYEYYEDLNMSVETEKLTEERAGKLCDRDDANGVSQNPGKWKNSPDENSKHSEPWRRRIAPLYQNDGAFELASHYRIDGRVEAEMSKRGSREKTLLHKEKKKRRGIPNRHLRKEDKSNVNFDEEQFHELENVKDDASVFIKENIEKSRDKSTEKKADEATERKPIELVEDTRHFEQIPMEVIMRKAKDDDDIDDKYSVRGRANDSKNRDKKKKKQRTHSQKPILVCGLPTPHKTKH
ncbi:hypothetical protein CHS0354_019720 [Potamilus streckersoni]|uniref:Uncharacterized protein n=1 Tax=Potamilus streckersoni TaxID=2493646 RepID=A0AAE0VSX8_9BIVA|nr:hypothetical protein CHS0354_019720 [Potamilus streckersoni]